MVIVEIGLPFLAALFGYLSWKRAALESPYELENTLRNRLNESANLTNFYNYQLARVQISEYGGWGYAIWKYLPYVGGVRGVSVVYLYFSSLNGQTPATLPLIEEIRSHSKFEPMPISNISWKDPVELMPEGDRNLEIVFDTVDPDEILKSINDLSSIMLELNSDYSD